MQTQTIPFWQRIQIPAQQRAKWYRALARVVGKGLSIYDVLSRQERSFTRTKHPLLPVVKFVLLRMRGVGRTGQQQMPTFASGLAHVVPSNEAVLIQAGEAAGRLAEGLAAAADLVEAKLRMQKAIQAEMTKPMIYVVVFFGFLMFLSVKLFPEFKKFRPIETWPSSAQMLAALADNSFWLGPATVALIVALAAGLFWLGRSWTGDLRDSFDRRAPIFRMMADFNAASFLSAISGFIASGIPFSDAVERIGRSGSEYMRYQMRRVKGFLRNGASMEEAIIKLPFVAPKHHWLIEVYGMSADPVEAYREIAKEMVDQVIERVRLVFSAIVSNLILVMLAGMIMWTWFSMMDIAYSGQSL